MFGKISVSRMLAVIMIASLLMNVVSAQAGVSDKVKQGLSTAVRVGDKLNRGLGVGATGAAAAVCSVFAVLLASDAVWGRDEGGRFGSVFGSVAFGIVSAVCASNCRAIYRSFKEKDSQTGETVKSAVIAERS